MPAKRSSRKSRPDRQSAELAAVTPANLDDVAITPVPTLPTGRPAAPKAGATGHRYLRCRTRPADRPGPSLRLPS